MKIKSIRLAGFKRFHDLQITDIPKSAKLVVLVGPNGSGKSSLFESFNAWTRKNKGLGGAEISYLSKDPSANIHVLLNAIDLDFHDYDVKKIASVSKKCFYIRGAYRYEADFVTHGVSKSVDPLDSQNGLHKVIDREQRVSENYNRTIGIALNELFDDNNPNDTKIVIRNRIIGKVSDALSKLFPDLKLESIGNPENGGTFKFSKGTSFDFSYKNLSAGEKAAFDIILDFIVKSESFDDTIFCIDEPELHMHTQLQSRLVRVLHEVMPDNCQLWIATHSIGMARESYEIEKKYPGEVSFIDFHDKNFDETTIIKPSAPTRLFWKNIFNTALGDLASLVIPQQIIVCEGKALGAGGRRPSFDASVYNAIFNGSYPSAEFIPMGGASEVVTKSYDISLLLRRLSDRVNVISLLDRDDRSDHEIQDLKFKGTRVLDRRDLESYLWDNEILYKLLGAINMQEKYTELVEYKESLLSKSVNHKNDIKAIAGDLYNYCKKNFDLSNCGNDSEAFAIATLAPLITPDTKIYQELERIIFI